MSTMRGSALDARIHNLLANIFPSPQLDNMLRCTAANIAFVLKSRYQQALNPENVDITSFVDDAECGPVRYVLVICHNYEEGYMRVELRAWVPTCVEATLPHVLEGNVLNEVKQLLSPIPYAIEGGRMLYAYPVPKNGDEDGVHGEQKQDENLDISGEHDGLNGPAEHGTANFPGDEQWNVGNGEGHNDGEGVE